MTALAIVQLSLAALQGLLPNLTASKAPVEVISEIEASIKSLLGVQQAIIDLDELESLRTKPLW